MAKGKKTRYFVRAYDGIGRIQMIERETSINRANEWADEMALEYPYVQVVDTVKQITIRNIFKV